jgi:hypothetical protein
MMPSREVVARTIRFQYPDRLPYDFPEKYGSDFFWDSARKPGRHPRLLPPDGEVAGAAPGRRLHPPLVHGPGRNRASPEGY